MVETPTPEVDVSLPDDEIDILNMDSVEASPTNQVFRTATAILALVRVGPLVLLSHANTC